jgi:drug/metabolite transporter (DMT)-like permease
MTTIAPSAPTAPSHAVQGIICVEVGMLFFVVQDGMMKTMLGLYPVWTLIFARSVVTVLVLVPVILLLGPPHRLLTPLWPLHLARAVLFASGFTLFYAAFPFMGLAEVSTIFFSAPLFTALLAAVWLHEKIGPHRIGALCVGFVGVIVAMNPTSAAFHWIAVFPLLCAVTYAASQVLARKIGERESTLTVGLYTIGFSGVLILPLGWMLNQAVDLGPEFHHLRWAWPLEALAGFDRLALLGFVGMAGYMLLSRAYQVANASLVAPFDYTYLPFATAMAYFLWQEVPSATTLLGMALIVGSGLYIGWREIAAARRRDEPLVVAEAVFVPGNPLPAPPTEPDPPPAQSASRALL